METGNENLITDHLEILAGLPLLTGCEIPGLFRTFSSKFEDLLYQKKLCHSIYLFSNELLQDLLLGKRRSLQFGFCIFLHQRTRHYVRL